MLLQLPEWIEKVKDVLMDDKSIIIEAIVRLFNAADRKEWDSVKDLLHYEVYFDYFSVSKQPGSKKKSDEIIQGWSQFLPIFSITHHIVSNFEVTLSESMATVFCKGHAVYLLNEEVRGEIWTTYSTYNFKLQKTGESWKITSIIYNLVYEGGNRQLPAIALERHKDEHDK